MTCRAAPRRRSTFFIMDSESDGGRRGQAKSDQELGQKEVGNASNQGTDSHGRFNSKTGEPQTRDEESLIRAGNEASPCKNKGGQEKDRGACGSVSNETPSGGRHTVCALVCGHVRPRSRRRCSRSSDETAAV